MKNNDEKIVTLADLQKDFEKERRSKGDTVIRPRNGENNFARQDDSFSSSPDFFRKLFKKVKDEKEGKGE